MRRSFHKVAPCKKRKPELHQEFAQTAWHLWRDSSIFWPLKGEAFRSAVTGGEEHAVRAFDA